jgi:hypothetical protein
LHFWEEVGAVEHISLPELENAVRREFNSRDDRLLREQIELMQTESRIRIQSKIKVWIKSPQTKSPQSSWETQKEKRPVFTKKRL